MKTKQLPEDNNRKKKNKCSFLIQLVEMTVCLPYVRDKVLAKALSRNIKLQKECSEFFSVNKNKLPKFALRAPIG
jgi:hypothetical protein